MTAAEFTEKHGPPWDQWYAMTPAERWDYSHKVLLPKWFELGGTTGPEWDPSDPMHDTYVEMGSYHQSDIPADCLADANRRREAYLALGGIHKGKPDWPASLWETCP
jgi:hypothetical protein